jgi:hypothetical protein
MDPDKMDATGKTIDGKKHTASLEHTVKLSDYSRKIVELASVSTPKAFVGNNPTIEGWEGRNERSRVKHGRGMGKPLEL